MGHFSRAAEFFEAVREASYELWRHDAKYNAMERRALALGGGMRPASSGPASDHTRPIDAMVDYESMMERRVDEWCATVDRGMAVLYGADWEHGIAKSIGLGYAEVLECIYVQRLPIKEASRRLRFSERTCQRMRRRALAFIDAVGVEAAINGG